MGPEYLTLDEFCAAYRISKETVYNQRYRRTNPGSLAVRLGKKLVFRKRDVEAWFDQEQKRSQQLAS